MALSSRAVIAEPTSSDTDVYKQAIHFWHNQLMPGHNVVYVATKKRIFVQDYLEEVIVQLPSVRVKQPFSIELARRLAHAKEGGRLTRFYESNDSPPPPLDVYWVPEELLGRQKAPEFVEGAPLPPAPEPRRGTPLFLSAIAYEGNNALLSLYDDLSSYLLLLKKDKTRRWEVTWHFRVSIR